MEETITRKKSALRTMLEMMDVPERRMDLDSEANLRWLNRNFRINNSEHPLFETANELLSWIIRAQAGLKMMKRNRPVC